MGSEIFQIFVPAISSDILYVESDFRVVKEKGFLMSFLVQWTKKDPKTIVLYENNTASKTPHHRHLQP